VYQEVLRVTPTPKFDMSKASMMSLKLSTDASDSPPNSTHATDVEKAQFAATTDGHNDTNIVDWDGPNDPENPQNW
jgi:hypothetical protein